MGLLTKWIFEEMADRLLSRLNAAVLDNIGAMLDSNTEEGLADYLDERTEDPDLQAALLPTSAALDRYALRANSYGLCDTIFADAKIRAWCSAVDAYVRSAAGGGSANFVAWVNANAVVLHPLEAEMFRRVLGETCLTLSGAIVGAAPPLMQMRAFDHVYTGAFGALVDDTVDAGDVGTADVALFAADNAYLVLQSLDQFDKVFVDLSTVASADVGLEAYYWNGSAWAVTALTDYTVGFSVNGGYLKLTKPTDWVPYNSDSDDYTRFNTAQEGEYYTLLLKRTTNTVETPPVATWIMHPGSEVLNAAGKFYGLLQPPLAVVRITGTNTCVVEVLSAPDNTRFLHPGVTNNVLKLRAITAFTNNLTFTLGYKDQGAVAATKAQSAWTQPIAAGDAKTLELADGDTGLDEVTGATCAIVTAATTGAFVIEVADYPRALGVK